MRGLFESIVVVAVVAFGCVDGVEREKRDVSKKESRSDAGNGKDDEGCRALLAFFDGDGDGRGRGTYDDPQDAITVDYCPGDDLPDGFVWHGYDCDDTDKSAYNVYPRDADGDGFGTKDEALSICAGATPPEGYATYRTDCDDSDPYINHDAIDYWGDGLDSNCDGLDIPQHCNPDDQSICQSCEERLYTKDHGIDTEPSCSDQPDLFIAELVDCVYRCELRYHIRIGNRGLASFEGDIILSINTPIAYAGLHEYSEIDVYTIPLKLQAGELSVPFSLPERLGILEISVGTGELVDCDLSNNQFRFHALRFECWVW